MQVCVFVVWWYVGEVVCGFEGEDFEDFYWFIVLGLLVVGGCEMLCCFYKNIFIWMKRCQFFLYLYEEMLLVVCWLGMDYCGICCLLFY